MSEPSPRPGGTPAELYRRLAARDPLAPAELAATFLDMLVPHRRAGYPHAHDHFRIEAAEDAPLAVIHDPARGDLVRERRHHHRREVRECVELEPADGNGPAEGDDFPSFDDPRLAAERKPR